MPSLMLSTAIMQAIGGYAGEAGPWWLWVPLYMIVGWSVTYGITYSVAKMCPNLKIGGWMFFGLFAVLELVAFLSGFATRPAAENIIRAGNDLAILSGVLAAGVIQAEQKTKQLDNIDPSRPTIDL